MTISPSQTIKPDQPKTPMSSTELKTMINNNKTIINNLQQKTLQIMEKQNITMNNVIGSVIPKTPDIIIKS